MIRNPDARHVVRLFGKWYWWQRGGDGRLTLQRALWVKEESGA